MRAAASGEIEVGGAPFAEAMYYCLGCRACETACPAGVEFGRLLEAARAAIDSSNGREPWQPEPAQKWLLDRIVGYPKRGRWRRWVAKRFPDLDPLQSLTPEVPRQGRRWRMPAMLGPSDVVTNGDAPSVRGTVALHPGCVQSVFLPGINA
jgi:glycolate oxidase iron-sulfur subunit